MRAGEEALVGRPRLHQPRPVLIYLFPSYLVRVSMTRSLHHCSFEIYGAVISENTRRGPQSSTCDLDALTGLDHLLDLPPRHARLAGEETVVLIVVSGFRRVVQVAGRI